MSSDWARPVVHWAIEAQNPEIQKAFYGGLFHWDLGPGDFAMIGAGLGGPEPGPGGHIQPSARSGIALYIQVRDLAETLGQVEKLGGTIVMPPFEIPGQPTMAAITDPEGNSLMLVQQ
jgi:uncharacterized protein